MQIFFPFSLQVNPNKFCHQMNRRFIFITNRKLSPKNNDKTETFNKEVQRLIRFQAPTLSIGATKGQPISQINLNKEHESKVKIDSFILSIVMWYRLLRVGIPIMMT